jgi:Iap family predicted aminopeptidase
MNMKKNRIFSLGLTGLLLGAISWGWTVRTAEPPVNAALVSTFRQIDEEVSARSEAYLRLGESIDQIGHRLTGSPNGEKAEAYVHSLLRSYGFENVRFQPFEVNGWIRESLDFKVSFGGQTTVLKSVALALTPAVANLDGELVDMGNGLESDYLANPEKAKGKIVLAALNILPGSPDGTRNVHRSAKVTLAHQYGAKGIILFNSVPGGTLLTGTGSIDGTLLSIPAITLGLEDGMKLKEVLSTQAVRGQLKMRNKTGKMTARNVVARIEGSEFPDEIIVVGGHLDSWDLSPGAVDNGLGSFSVIDMARTFIQLGLKPKRTVEFVLFMGEEQGLLGSKAYVQDLQKQGKLDQVRFMINFDMTNDPKFFTATLEAARPLFHEISEAVMQVDPSFQNRFTPRAGLYSDHQPFMLQGIPTGGAGGGQLSREAGSCYHADCDVFSLVNDLEMRNTVRFGAMLAYGLADAQQIPVKRLNDGEVKQLMLDNKLEESLRIGGDWRW